MTDRTTKNSSSDGGKIRMISLSVVDGDLLPSAQQETTILSTSTWANDLKAHDVNRTSLKLILPSPLSEWRPLLTFSTSMDKIPLVYSPKYNISFFYLERILHSFDAQKYGKVFQSLSKSNQFTLEQCYQPLQEVSHQDLLLVHTEAYLQSLSSSAVIARIAEVPPLGLFPNVIIQWKMLSPMRYAVQGTILASELALEHGWSINIGGGYHHAKVNSGEGFCVYADIPLAIRKLQLKQKIRTAMMVDLDAHQGNGLPTIFTQPTEKTETTTKKQNAEMEDADYTKYSGVDIFDMYNGDIYPQDTFAGQFITFDYPLKRQTKDEQYLTLLSSELPTTLNYCRPDIVFYNAGTDIYEADPLGALSISKTAIIVRDEIVFRLCRDRHIPIVMVLSGGYTLESATIIAESLQNLHEKGLINLSGKA